MTHHIGAEHIGWVNATRYGTALNEVTLAAAIADIGSTPAVLVVTNSGSGIWTVNTNLVIPSNVILYIPVGVSVTVTTGHTLTINGQVIALNPNWITPGGGATVHATPVGYYVEFSRIISIFGFLATTDGIGFVSGLPAGNQIIVSNKLGPTEGGSTGNCVIRYAMAPGATANVWEAGINTLSQWYVGRPGAGAHVLISQGGVSLSNSTSSVVATHSLHMAQDDAFKATASWSVPSDERLKTVLGTYEEGLAHLEAMPQLKRFTWNGKAGTPTDGKEQIGWLAQEAAPVAPGLFMTYEDKLEPSDPETTTLYSANYSPLVFTLVNAVKELSAQVTALTDRVAALEALAGSAQARVTALEAAAHGHSASGNAGAQTTYTPPADA